MYDNEKKGAFSKYQIKEVVAYSDMFFVTTSKKVLLSAKQSKKPTYEKNREVRRDSMATAVE